MGAVVTPEKRIYDYNAAADSLMIYFDAQNEFKSRGLARFEGVTINKTGYCDNFRNLYYGFGPDGQPFSLIPKEMADSDFRTYENEATSTMGNPEKYALPQFGFIFFSDPYIRQNNLWEHTFGLVATTEKILPTDNKLLWIGNEGIVLCTIIPRNKLIPFSEDYSPLHPGCKLQWEKYEREVK